MNASHVETIESAEKWLPENSSEFRNFCRAVVQDFYSALMGVRETAAARKVLNGYAASKPEMFDTLSDLAEECTQTVRRYSGASYAWISHPRLDVECDPMPSCRFPRSLTCIEIAKAVSVLS